MLKLVFAVLLSCVTSGCVKHSKKNLYVDFSIDSDSSSVPNVYNSVGISYPIYKQKIWFSTGVWSNLYTLDYGAYFGASYSFAPFE